jgi:hypothetical protein
VVDIIGNSPYAALQYAQDSSYIYFKLQINDANIVTSPNAAYMIYLDRVGSGGTVDYAFAWDAKSNDITQHGVEMMKYASGTTWGTLKMTDVDGLIAAKGSTDINGGGVRGTACSKWNMGQLGRAGPMRIAT